MPQLLILGAGSDIAQACARRFAYAGFNIMLAGRLPHNYEAFASELKMEYDVTVSIWPFDGTAYSSHKPFYEPFAGKIDVALLAFGYLSDGTESEDALKVMETNYVGAVSILDVVAADFKRRKMGCIIGISSVAGERGRRKRFRYASAKAGLTTYLSGLRAELQPHGIHVSTVKPGFIQTKMIAGMEKPGFLTHSAAQMADIIYRKAYKNERNVVYSSGLWRLIMWVIRHIPESIFKRINF